MKTYSTTEYATIQKPLIEFLKKMGYTYISPQEMQNMRVNASEVILKDILRTHLSKATFTHKGENIPFSLEGIARALRELQSPSAEGLLKSNEKISNKLLYGIEVPQTLQDGSVKNQTLPLIDFSNPYANDFSFTQEFEVLRVQKGERQRHRRPDIVVFINGIPIVVIELKKSSVSIEEGISQMIRNQKEEEIPQLFRFIQLTFVGSNQEAKYGTVGTQKKHYASWVEEDEKYLPPFFGELNANAIEKLMYSLLSKERLLEMISSFIVFEKSSKKVARHQQYFAIKQTLKRVQSHSGEVGEKPREGGLIWHTQGSGKSLTMSLLATELKHSISGAKIIIVTDRKDLDTQIHKVFGNVGICVSQAKSSTHLKELLGQGVSVITTLVHKFLSLKDKVIQEGRDIFVLVDEAHRTQGGELHACMKKVFPNGCYIGFTGTPLLSKEKGSLQKFGGFIHKYTIKQALRDEAVLPLYYEGRMIEQFINNEAGLNKRFEILCRDLSDEQKSDLKAKFTQFRKIAPNLERLEWIAWDIYNHFKAYPFKAMLATSSKYEAIKYHQIFQSKGWLRSAFVISAPDMREGYEEVESDNADEVRRAWEELMKKYSNEEAYMQYIQDEFVHGDEIELLIVVDKLLTGFDAPNIGCLYIDKSLKEHNLLQAIARANRLFEDKECGLIIDYRGLLEDLSKALSEYEALSGYDAHDIAQAVISLKEHSLGIREKYQALEKFFSGAKSQEDYEVFLGDKEKREEFYSLLLEFSKSLKLLFLGEGYQEDFTSKEIETFKRALKFYIQLKSSVQIRYHQKVDFKAYEKQMQELLDRYVGANEAQVLVELVKIFDENFLSEGEGITQNAQADRILSATSQVAIQEREKNPFFYDDLSQRINRILEDYRQNRIDEATKLLRAKEIYQELKGYNNNTDQNYPKALNKIAQKAFYDNLKSKFNDEQKLIEFVLRLDEVFVQKSQKPDWEHNSEVSKQIEQIIDDLLYEYEVDIASNRVEELIVQIREIGQKNYAGSQNSL
ncbi:type I restriction endonuclease subunit R [Helicobacter cholecystus]|uniref:Type I restriction enzyme endonuclease subunit n=1 Tax=Helicobacter cholecystus TaxID=45498 RepID=A0A3D8IWN6_9HELI|nr:type I restriction endonuclease subunit R [Helicobacter cholecystus]RDU69453.1 type I restriction endonuclease subunit R [Helicobacter cholecystus]VEJ24004.1 type I restriction enzyme restriction subunit [Helicobacter cholecystus]